jgi:hypothetical protein
MVKTGIDKAKRYHKQHQEKESTDIIPMVITYYPTNPRFAKSSTTPGNNIKTNYHGTSQNQY